MAVHAQRVGEHHSKASRDMIVAHARLAHRVVDADRLEARRRDRSDLRDAFEHRGDVPAGKLEITVAALLGRHDQLRPRELAQVTARGLRRYVRRVGKLARGQRPPIEQRGEDIRAGRIADQCGDGGEIENLAHGAKYSARVCGRHAAMLRWGPKRSCARFDDHRNKEQVFVPILSSTRQEKVMPTFDLYLPPKRYSAWHPKRPLHPVVAALALIARWFER